jgi:hypothetical protein
MVFGLRYGGGCHQAVPGGHAAGSRRCAGRAPVRWRRRPGGHRWGWLHPIVVRDAEGRQGDIDQQRPHPDDRNITRTPDQAVCLPNRRDQNPPAVAVGRRHDEDGGNYREDRIEGCRDSGAIIAFDRFMMSGGEDPNFNQVLLNRVTCLWNRDLGRMLVPRNGNFDENKGLVQKGELCQPFAISVKRPRGGFSRPSAQGVDAHLTGRRRRPRSPALPWHPFYGEGAPDLCFPFFGSITGRRSVGRQWTVPVGFDGVPPCTAAVSGRRWSH